MMVVNVVFAVALFATLLKNEAENTELDGFRFLGRAVKIFQSSEEWPFGREPQLARMSDGSLFCAIFSGGKQEPSPANCVIAVRSYDDGRTWTKPERIIGDPKFACWATELFTFGAEPELVFQTYYATRTYAELRPFRVKLGKDGKGPFDGVSFHGVPPNFSVRQGKVLSDGTWIFPVYWLENTGRWTASLGYPEKGGVDWSNWDWKKWHYCSGVIRSTDSGKTWSVHGVVGDGATRNVWEPCVIELEPGHVRMWLRAGGGLWFSDSRDYGLTWTKIEKSDIPNPDTKPMVLRHRNDIILVNNVTGKGFNDRRRLELWVSHDFCQTWMKYVAAEKTDGGEAFLCYPSGFLDDAKSILYLAVDSCSRHYMTKIPYVTIGLK